MRIKRLCVASCAGRDGRTVRTPFRTSGTGTAGRPCVCGSGGSVRRSGRISIRNPSRRTGTASRPCASVNGPSGATISCTSWRIRRGNRRASTNASGPKFSGPVLVPFCFRHSLRSLWRTVRVSALDVGFGCCYLRNCCRYYYCYCSWTCWPRGNQSSPVMTAE